MRILIGGGTGYLGTELRERLHRDGHQTITLTRSAPRDDQVRWDPGRVPLDPEVVAAADVVINVAGSSLLGNPHSAAYERRLFQSRVDTTRTLAEAIAKAGHQPVFLAGNGSSWYGDHGDEPLTESSDSRGDALLTRVTREWQAATEPAAAAGARTCILRTAPVFGRGSLVATALRRVFGLGLGGRLGDGRQYFPLISGRDWTDAVVRMATDDSLEGPVNLSIPDVPTNAEFTRALSRVLHRPAVVPVPAPLIRLAAGPMAPELLSSVRTVPQKLLDAGFRFAEPTVTDVLTAAMRRA